MLNWVYRAYRKYLFRKRNTVYIYADELQIMISIKNNIQNFIPLSYQELKYIRTLDSDDLYNLIVFYNKCINYMG